MNGLDFENVQNVHWYIGLQNRMQAKFPSNKEFLVFAKSKIAAKRSEIVHCSSE
ncbi:hypothetical protein RBSWK_00487 [Rhodopirellula baltica SWK14]|uniref:Uncharacterized protein n=1 Tax=Rhodopirellula baltica SWK14 TaxID=993516 RepID=L7CNP8_RHOBT|nr:hypothetical protein RBSWK_00487 [Rhodopirellula baltica SWK14]